MVSKEAVCALCTTDSSGSVGATKAQLHASSPCSINEAVACIPVHVNRTTTEAHAEREVQLRLPKRG
jgi:hypothetical protein